MKIKFLILVFVFLSILIFTPDADAATRVKSYVKKNGTYVAPHFKTSPDTSKLNNYSAKGNINPFNGKKGTVNPYKAPSIKTSKTKFH